jgi:N-ethylmaleimide reductase
MANTTIPNALLSPVKVGGLQLKNRIALAPMTRARSGKDRIPNELMAEYYTQRASAGLIITEATTVSEQGNGWINSPGIYTDAMVEGWKKVVDAVHAKGGTIFLQLWHTGRASHSDFHGGELPVAPSAIKLNGDSIHTPKGKKDYETPRALETHEVEAVVADYKRAAERAKEAGFDGVEVHSANGYLLDEFLQSKTNHRTDKYGGSVEKRFTLLNEILQAVLEVLPANRVGVRLAPNGAFNDMGSPDYREQFTYAAKQLDGFGLAYLHVMDGLAFGFHELGEPMTLNDFRAVYTGTLIGNCGYDKGSADAAIAEGRADLIAIGRPYISNPDLVERYANGWDLNPESDMSGWYSPIGAKGYTDFPHASGGSSTS